MGWPKFGQILINNPKITELADVIGGADFFLSRPMIDKKNTASARAVRAFCMRLRFFEVEIWVPEPFFGRVNQGPSAVGVAKIWSNFD